MLTCFFTRHGEVVRGFTLPLPFSLLASYLLLLEMPFHFCLSSKLLHILQDPAGLWPVGAFGGIPRQN